jgi:hypothetical protein
MMLDSPCLCLVLVCRGRYCLGGVVLLFILGSKPGVARTILLFHIISARPSKQPRMVRAFLRYTRGLGWRIHCGVEVTESSTNKQHHHHNKCRNATV